MPRFSDPSPRRRFLKVLGGAVAAATLRQTRGAESTEAADAVRHLAPPGKAVIAPVGGVPTLTIDGQPCGPMFYTPGGRDAWERPEMARRGFQVFFEFVHEVGWP